MRGLFITFEGIDRSGKTTQAGLLVDALGDAALGVREPGGTPAGERLREVLKDPLVALAPATEALLFAAARSELVANVVLPALDAGKVVVSDRFLDSSLAYQGGARGLGIEDVGRVNQFATRGRSSRPRLAPPTSAWCGPTPSAGAASTRPARQRRSTRTSWLRWRPRGND